MWLISRVAIMAEKSDVAEWLINEIRSNGASRSYQAAMVRGIRDKFGEEWLYRNHNGNPAIDRGVLQAFGALKDEYVQWDRSDQSWRIVTAEQLEDIRRRDAQRKERSESALRRQAEREASNSRG
jgi:hypothetical protein